VPPQPLSAWKRYDRAAWTIRGGAHASVRHDSAEVHVTGQALYVDDVPSARGTLDAALVLSPHAHARILHIDVSRALAAPGSWR